MLPVQLLLLLLKALLILFGQIETTIELVLLNTHIARVSALAGKRVEDVAPRHRRILGLLLVDSLPQLLQPGVVILLRLLEQSNLFLVRRHRLLELCNHLRIRLDDLARACQVFLSALPETLIIVSRPNPIFGRLQLLQALGDLLKIKLDL